jgi:hypothetical protein
MKTGVLTWLRARLAGWFTVRCLLFLSGTVALFALILVMMDAMFDLPESVRTAAPWMLGGCGLGVILATALHWRWLNEARLARQFEQTIPGLGNRITNAVQLANRSTDTAVGEYLRREAIHLGRKSSRTLSAWKIVRRGFAGAGALFVLAAAAWLTLLGLGAEITGAVFPRFLDPYGDHPPYSTLKLEVEPGAGEVLFGGQFEIRASARGRPVDKLWVVSRTPTNETRAIMFLSPDRSFFQTLANLREPAEYFVTDGQARSRRFPIRIRYTPQITLAEMVIQYPDYTSKSPRTTRLADEPMALPEETQISFRLASNRPLKSGILTLTPVLGGKTEEITLHPDPAQDSIVTGGFKLSTPVAFTLNVRDVSGLVSADSRRGRFNVAPDQRPKIFVLEPGRNAVATPSIRVPVKVEAQDDFGITRVVWLRGHNRSIERPFNMTLELKNGAQSVESSGALELNRLGVQPGDVIDYYFEAADNYPKGPNITLSRIYRLEIISDEKYREILRQTAARKALFEPYFKMGGWLRRLAEQARDLQDKARDGDPGAEAAAKELADQLDQYHDELGKLMRNPLMFDVEQSFRNTLVTQHTLLGAARDQLKQSAGGGRLDAKSLKELADQLTALSEQEQDQIGQPAQQIASVVRLVSKADTFVKLAQQQATLAQMLRRFSDRTDALSRLEQLEVQELALAQARVRDALKTLVAQLPELLANVPEEPAYETLRDDVANFLKAVAESKVETDLADAARTLAEPDTLTGYTLAQQAAVKMDKLITKCNALPEQGQQCLTARFQPKLSKPGMGNTLQQILAAMNQGQGPGQGGQDGYGLFNEDVALYGPNVELAGEQAGGRRDGNQGTGRSRQIARVGGTAEDPSLPKGEGPGRVRLQPDAKFPLRYRELVGEYFRAIAETDTGGSK